LTDRRWQSADNVRENQEGGSVTKLDLVEEFADVHEDHGTGSERATLFKQPHWGKVLDKGSDVQALTDGLNDGKREGTVSVGT